MTTPNASVASHTCTRSICFSHGATSYRTPPSASKSPAFPRADADAKATELAQRFGIADFLNAYPATLSGGMRQRVALLRAVLPDRDVLLLDEPFKALDAITRAELQRWLSDVLDRTNRATVMVTHDVEEALMLGDRVLVMSPRPGRILLELDVDLPRPRPRDVVRESKFVELKWQLLSVLSW